MNLRVKTNCGQADTIVNCHGKLSPATVVAFIIVLLAHVQSVSAAARNTLVFPVAVSFPAASDAIEKSLIKFGNDRFQSGFDVSQKLADVKISDPFDVRLSGVAYKGRINGRLDRDAKGLIVEAKLKNLELTIDRISIHTVVNAKVSGVDASIRIDAECTNSVISWQNQIVPFFARGRLFTSPALALDMSGLALTGSLQKPSMRLSCQGPFGMDQLIRDYAWSAIQARWTDSGFAKEIEDQIEAAFAKRIAPGGPGLNLVNQPGLNVTIFPQQYVVSSGASHMRARLEMQLDRPLTLPALKIADVSLPAGKIEQVMLRLPSAAAQSILQEVFSVGGWSHWVEGQTVEGFRELMSSRFRQMFAFPDLQNYAKDAPFWFALNMTETPTLRCAAGAFELNTPVGAWMMLKETSRPMGYKPMAYFKIPTSISISLPQSKSRIPMAAKVRSVDLSYEFDSAYVDAERPNTIIAVEQIRNSIQDYVESQTSNLASNLTTIDGAIGESVKALNQTDMTCDANRKTIEIRLPL